MLAPMEVYPQWRLAAKWCRSRFDTASKRLLVSTCSDAKFPPRKRPRRLARPRTSPFHGGNTGSNPVGDANKISNLSHIPIAKGPTVRQTYVIRLLGSELSQAGLGRPLTNVCQL